MLSRIRGWQNSVRQETMRPNRNQFIEDCRKQRTALIEMVAALKAKKNNNAGQNSATAQTNAALDARILNCECSIARYEIIIMEAERKALA